MRWTCCNDASCGKLEGGCGTGGEEGDWLYNGSTLAAYGELAVAPPNGTCVADVVGGEYEL